MNEAQQYLNDDQILDSQEEASLLNTDSNGFFQNVHTSNNFSFYATEYFNNLSNKYELGLGDVKHIGKNVSKNNTEMEINTYWNKTLNDKQIKELKDKLNKIMTEQKEIFGFKIGDALSESESAMMDSDLKIQIIFRIHADLFDKSKSICLIANKKMNKEFKEYQKKVDELKDIIKTDQQKISVLEEKVEKLIEQLKVGNKRKIDDVIKPEENKPKKVKKDEKKTVTFSTPIKKESKKNNRRLNNSIKKEIKKIKTNDVSKSVPKKKILKKSTKINLKKEMVAFIIYNLIECYPEEKQESLENQYHKLCKNFENIIERINECLNLNQNNINNYSIIEPSSWIRHSFGNAAYQYYEKYKNDEKMKNNNAYKVGKIVAQRYDEIKDNDENEDDEEPEVDLDEIIPPSITMRSLYPGIIKDVVADYKKSYMEIIKKNKPKLQQKNLYCPI